MRSFKHRRVHLAIGFLCLMTPHQPGSCSLHCKTSSLSLLILLHLPVLRMSPILFSSCHLFLFLLSVASSSLSFFAFSPVQSPPPLSSSPSFVVTVKTCAVPPPLLSSTINPHLFLFPPHLLRTIGPAAAYGCVSHAKGSGFQLLVLSSDF